MIDIAFYLILVLAFIGVLLISVGIAWNMSIDYGIRSPIFLISLGTTLLGVCFFSYLILIGYINSR